jgi:hypothetical protein
MPLRSLTERPADVRLVNNRDTFTRYLVSSPRPLDRKACGGVNTERAVVRVVWTAEIEPPDVRRFHTRDRVTYLPIETTERALPIPRREHLLRPGDTAAAYVVWSGQEGRSVEHRIRIQASLKKHVRCKGVRELTLHQHPSEPIHKIRRGARRGLDLRRKSTGHVMSSQRTYVVHGDVRVEFPRLRPSATA